MSLSLNRFCRVLTVVLVLGQLGPIVERATAQDEIIKLVIDELKSGDPERQTGAIAIVRDIPGETITKALADEMPNLAPAVQVQVLSALADRGDATALPAVMEASTAQDESVRVAALKTIGQLGDVSSVPLLAQRAAQTRGAEQKAARDSLYRLRGTEIGTAILESLASAQANVKVELIRAIGERNITQGVEALRQATKDEDRKVRRESLKVLKVVAGPDQLPSLVDLVLNLASESDRNEAEKTVAAVAHKIEDPQAQAAAVLTVLPKVKDVKDRASLLRILGRIGDPSALPALRAALNDPEKAVQDAALRALADWPAPEPVPDLLKIAQSADSPVHKILALRGLVRLLALESDRPAQETIELFAQAMDLAPNAAEKKRVLSGLGR
ncbi:MAG: HEAT repeat domain-containing protein, partial [Phycisphaerales bacterium]